VVAVRSDGDSLNAGRRRSPRSTGRRTALAFVAAALAVQAAAAHHAFQAEFDAKKPVSLSGVIVRVEWTNPHAWFHIEVKSEDGSKVEWAVQAASPQVLTARGWKRDSLTPGMSVRIAGFQARDGKPTANGRDITLPDGRQLCANLPCRCCAD
jgi:hypothetical protein